MEGEALKILDLQKELRSEFFAASKIPAGFPISEYDSISSLLKGIKESKGTRFGIIIFLPKSKFDARKIRRIRIACLEAPLCIVTRKCTEMDYLMYLAMGVNAVLQPPFDRVDIHQVLCARKNGEIAFPRSSDVMKESQVRLDFLMPSKLSRILGINRLVSLLASEFGFPPEEAQVNLPLVMDEALTNAIVHGNQKREDLKVHVRIYISSNRFFAQIEDEGKGFDYAAANDPKSAENIYRRSGRGIYLMRKLMDRVEYKNAGKVLELEKRNPLNGF